jgi:hypothetical protein
MTGTIGGDRRAPARRLSGSRLVLVRAAWFVFAGVMIGLFVAAVPARFNQLLTVTPLGDNALVVLSTSEAAALQQHGISTVLYALYFILLEIFFAAVFCLFGGLLFLRRSTELLAMFASLALIAVGVLIPGTLRVLDTPTSGLEYLVHLVQVLGWISFFTSFHIFPDARFVPGWTRFLLIPFAIWGVAWIFVPTANAFNWSLPLALFAFGAVSLIGVFAQVYRYVRVSSLVERQQTKWVLLGFVGATLGIVIFAIPGVVWSFLNSPGLPRVIYHVIGIAFFAISMMLIPVTIEISVRRYRLWAIDPLINRVLVYSLLTVGLALVYAVCVVLLQQAFRSITGAGDDLAVVVSTLAIAALFSPLRRRIQDSIDRRFYRQKYDATRILAEFGATMRDQVDLDELSDSLLTVVKQTIQPTYASLWLVKK